MRYNLPLNNIHEPIYETLKNMENQKQLDELQVE